VLPISSTYKLVHQNFPRLSVFPDGYPTHTMRSRMLLWLMVNGNALSRHMSYRLTRYKGLLPVRPICMRYTTRAGHLATSRIVGASSTTATSACDVVDLQLVAPPDALSVPPLRPRMAVVAVLTDVAPTSGRGVVEHVRQGPHNHVVHSLRRHSAA